MTEQSLLAHMQDNVSSSPILNSPQNPPSTAQEDAATTNERYTFSVVTSSRYESLVEENQTITESSPTGTQAIISQPSNQPTTTSTSTPTEMQKYSRPSCNRVRTKHGPGVHEPPPWTGSIDHFHGPGPWTVFLK